MREKAHVLTCTVETLSLAVVAGIQAWGKYEYHLCVRLDRGKRHTHGMKRRYDRPPCHGLRAKSILVTLEV